MLEGSVTAVNPQKLLGFLASVSPVSLFTKKRMLRFFFFL